MINTQPLTMIIIGQPTSHLHPCTVQHHPLTMIPLSQPISQPPPRTVQLYPITMTPLSQPTSQPHLCTVLKPLQQAQPTTMSQLIQAHSPPNLLAIALLQPIKIQIPTSKTHTRSNLHRPHPLVSHQTFSIQRQQVKDEYLSHKQHLPFTQLSPKL